MKKIECWKKIRGERAKRTAGEWWRTQSSTYCCATQEVDKVMSVISKIVAVTLFCNPKTKEPGLGSHLSFMHPKYLICTRCSAAWSCWKCSFTPLKSPEPSTIPWLYSHQMPSVRHTHLLCQIPRPMSSSSQDSQGPACWLSQERLLQIPKGGKSGVWINSCVSYHLLSSIFS